MPKRDNQLRLFDYKSKIILSQHEPLQLNLILFAFLLVREQCQGAPFIRAARKETHLLNRENPRAEKQNDLN